MAGVDRRRALQLLGGLGAAGLVTACGSEEASESTEPLFDSPVRIGLVVPGSGGNEAIGDEIRNGFQHYVRTHGNRLGGHPVTEEERDEGESPEEAQAAVEELLDLDVHAIVGIATSSALLAIRDQVETAHIPLLGTNASPRDLQGVTYMWRTSYVNQEPGLALGRHLAAATTGPVAVISQDDPTGTDAVAGLREAFATARADDRLAEPILTPTRTDPGPGDDAAALAQVAALDPEAVFACYAGDAAVAFVQEYLAAGFEADRLYGPAYLTEGAALAGLGSAAIGIRTSANYAPELRSATNRAFAVGYRSSFGSPPTMYAVAAYDAAAALDKALRLTTGLPNRRQINLMLSRIGLLDSPRGRWQFNQSRTPTQKWYLREVAEDGPLLANVLLRDLGTLG